MHARHGLWCGETRRRVLRQGLCADLWPACRGRASLQRLRAARPSRGDLAEVIPRFIVRVLNGLPPVIFGSGERAAISPM